MENNANRLQEKSYRCWCSLKAGIHPEVGLRREAFYC